MKLCSFFILSINFLSFLFGNILPNELVAVHLNGGLGNQLFNFSTAYAHSRHNNIPLILTGDINRNTGLFTILGDKFQKIPLQNLQHLFSTPNGQYPNPFKKVKGTSYHYCFSYSDELINEKNIVYVGNYLSEKWFVKYKNEIIDILQPPELIKKSIQKKYKKILKHPLKVGIHIRTWVPDNHPWTKNSSHSNLIPTKKYLEQAMEYFSNEALFVVTSDCIPKAKKILEGSQKKILFLNEGSNKRTGNNKTLEDFYLLSFCDHNILTAGTFGWWAAYLNPNEDKIIIAPENGVIPDNKKEEYWPEGYILLPMNYF